MNPREGKDSDSSDSRKYLLFLCYDLFCRFFWIFFSLLFSPSVVLVDFIGTMKSN